MYVKLENVFYADSILEVTPPGGAAPYKPLSDTCQEHNLVRQVTFRFQCHGTAVNERSALAQGGSVIQQFLPPFTVSYPNRPETPRFRNSALSGEERNVW